MKFEHQELNQLLTNYDVSSVLRKPLTSKSKYAKRLNLTYKIDLTKSNEANLERLRDDIGRLGFVEYAEIFREDQSLISCSTNDPDDASWNLSRHEITCVQEAHCITTGDPNIIIAARDNGFMLTIQNI